MTKSKSQPEPKKRGRPRIGEKREKPWLKAKMSRATWYRRQKDAAAHKRQMNHLKEKS